MTQPVGHVAFPSREFMRSPGRPRPHIARRTLSRQDRVGHEAPLSGEPGWLRSGKRRKRGDFNEGRTRFRVLHRYRRDRLGSRLRRSRRRQTQARTSKAANRKNVLQRENVLRQERLHDEGQVRRQTAYESARGRRKAAAVMTAVEDDEGDRVVQLVFVVSPNSGLAT